MTGPVADRVDIVRNLMPLSRADRGDRLTLPESSTAIRERVTAARIRQAERYAGESWGLNGHAPGPVLRERWPLTEPAQRLVDDRVYDGRLSRRGATACIGSPGRWPTCDGSTTPASRRYSVALRLRTGEPLLVGMLERAS